MAVGHVLVSHQEVIEGLGLSPFCHMQSTAFFITSPVLASLSTRSSFLTWPKLVPTHILSLSPLKAKPSYVRSSHAWFACIQPRAIQEPEDISQKRNSTHFYDVILIGSGLGALSAAALLARYGKSVLVLESHYVPGGAAHSFKYNDQGYEFDSGPSFFCGISRNSNSLNPLRMVLDAVGERVYTKEYDQVCYHFPEGKMKIATGDGYIATLDRYEQELERFSPTGKQEFIRLKKRLLLLYDAMQGIPTIALRADWKVAITLFSKYPYSMLKLLPFVSDIQAPLGSIMKRLKIRDKFLTRLIDLECFLLSGVKSDKTITAEVAFMLGERQLRKLEYPVGGSGAIVNAFIRGIEKYGGKIRLRSHVKEIVVKNNTAIGVRLKSGEIIRAKTIISNASLWDTYGKLIKKEHMQSSFYENQMKIPFVESFMHIHLGIKAEGLDNLGGHHAVILNGSKGIEVPGNTVMISIPTVWDPSLAPEGRHAIHCYTLEPYDGWVKDETYEAKKREKARPLFDALRKIIPDLDERIEFEKIGTPLTHERFLRRHKGTYGPAIEAGKAIFPGPATPIKGLYRVGDSVTPGIGVPAVVASGILCANSLVSLRENEKIIFDE